MYIIIESINIIKDLPWKVSFYKAFTKIITKRLQFLTIGAGV